MFRSPTFWKLFGTYVALAIACLIGASYATIRSQSEFYEGEAERRLIERAEVLATTLESAYRSGAADLEVRVRDLSNSIGNRITLIRPDGVVVADSDRVHSELGNHSDRPEFQAAMRGQVASDVRHSASLDRKLLYAAVPMGREVPPLAVFRLAVPHEEVTASSNHLMRVVVWSAALGLLAAIVLAFFVARSLTRPVVAMAEVVHAFREGDFQHRVRTPIRGQLGRLVSSFNLMGAELERRIKAIEQDREETRTLLAAMVEGVIAVDREGRIFLVNDAARQIFGIAEDTPLHERDLTEVVRISPILRAVAETIDNRRPTTFEVELLDGTERLLEAQTAPIPGSRGGCVVVFHDISRVRKLENIRREFVANVSHELRTPLTSIKGYVETLLSGGVHDRAHNLQFLQKVSSNADRLHALITDLLSLSRLESQNEPYALVSVDLRGIVDKSVASFRDRASTKQMSIEITGDFSGVRVLGDEGGLTQVLDNLLDNAIKYTPEGGRVLIEVVPEDSRVRLAVQDTGVGIPAKDLPRIFERFYRVDRARSRELGGTGLGLAIVKHIVQALRGTIEVTSELGRGSRFVVTLQRADRLVMPQTVAT